METPKGFPSVAAVVLNYRRPEETAACVQALVQSSLPPASIVVVDNDSGDGSVAWLRSAVPQVEIAESGKNLGYAGGMNVGLRRVLLTNAAYVLVVNSDTLVDPATVETLVRALEWDPSAGAATGTFYYHPETTRIWYAGGDLVWWRANAVARRSLSGESPRVTGESPRAIGEASAPSGKCLRYGENPCGLPEARRVSFLTGCAILFRATSLRSTGLFDERYFMYQEDAELCARFIMHGFRLLYVPHAVLYHRMTVDAQTPLKVYFTMRNRLLLLETAPNRWIRCVGTAYFGLMLFLKLAWWSVSEKTLFHAACMGVLDYAGRRFHEGRGLGLTPCKTPG